MAIFALAKSPEVMGWVASTWLSPELSASPVGGAGGFLENQLKKAMGPSVRQLLANTKLGKDDTQQIVRRELPGDFAQGVVGQPEFFSQ
jgi:hypothetical protein